MRSPLPRPSARPSRRQRRSPLAEHGDERLAVAGEAAVEPGRLLGRRDAQRPVELRQRVLVEHEAGDAARRGVARLAGLGGLEAVDLGAALRGHGAAGLERGDVALGCDVEPGRRGVDGLGAGHDRVAVDVEQALVEVDRQHGQQVQAAEAARVTDVVAGGDGAAERAAGDVALQHRARDEAAHGRRGDRGRADVVRRRADDDACACRRSAGRRRARPPSSSCAAPSSPRGR